MRAQFTIAILALSSVHHGAGVVALSVGAPTTKALQKQAASNLLSICGHLQDYSLYSVDWAGAAVSCDQNGLIASRDVEQGEVLSLFPVHAVGIRDLGSKKGSDFLVFDDVVDGDFFRKAPPTSRRQAQRVDLDNKDMFDGKLFVRANPTRPPLQGWLAHLATTNDDYANCDMVVPFASPLICSLVATADIRKGQMICRGSATRSAPLSLVDTMRTQYRGEIAELEQYLRMAMPQPSGEIAQAAGPSSNQESTSFASYHSINSEYPGIKTLHKDPNVLEIDNFLTHGECDRIIAKAQPHLIPCVTKNPTTGAVEVDPDRTSANANVPQVEIPTIVSKVMELTSIDDPSRLEIFQVLRYTNGQEFKEHTDGFSGPTIACGYKDSGRLVTIFCYLNDVEKGGETRFTQLRADGEDRSTPLDVIPAKGKAVIHFPATYGLEQDPRTEHQGMKAIDEKWLLVTWVWLHPRSDDMYSEKYLPPLSADII